MRLSRSIEERLTDMLLTLALYSLCAQEGRVGDRLKAMKLVFDASHRLFSQQIKAFNYSFYRYSYGPFTPELYETWEELSWAGLLEIGPGPRGQITLSPAGQRLASQFSEQVLSLPANKLIHDVLVQVQDTASQLSTAELLARIYEQPARPLAWREERPIRNLPHGVYLTCALDPQEAVQTITIPRKWLQRIYEIRASGPLNAIGDSRLSEAAELGFDVARSEAQGADTRPEPRSFRVTDLASYLDSR